MRIRLIILLISFSVRAFGQWAFSAAIGSGSLSRPTITTNAIVSFLGIASLLSNTDGSEYFTAAFTPHPSTLLLACVVTSDITAPAVHSVTSLHGTWTQLTNQLFDVIALPLHRISLWQCILPAAVSSALTNKSAGTGCGMRVVEFSGIDTNAPVVQVIAAGADLSSNPTIALSGLASHNRNAVFVVLANTLALFGGTPEANWLEDLNSGYTLPPTGLFTTYALGTSDNTINVTATSASWGGIAVEVKVEP